MMLHYYSFYIGEPKQSMKNWKLDDCKLPAYDAKSAIMLHHFLQEYLKYHSEHWISREMKSKYIPPHPYIVENYYRGLIEWDKIDRKNYGKTLVNYRKSKFYSQHQIMDLYRF